MTATLFLLIWLVGMLITAILCAYYVVRNFDELLTLADGSVFFVLLATCIAIVVWPITLYKEAMTQLRKLRGNH